MRVRLPLWVKISAASFTVVLVAIAFVAAVGYRAQRRLVEEKCGLELLHIAQTAALFLDGEGIENIHTNEDATSEEFTFARRALERVREANGLQPNEVYVLRVDGAELEWVITLGEDLYVGRTFTPGPENLAVAQRVFSTGQAGYTPIYTDMAGSFVSALAPVRERGGKIVALLQVDQDVSQVLAEIKRQILRQAWAVPAALGLALLLSLAVAHSLTRSVAALVEGTRAVERGEYDHPVRVRSRDELRTLADAFNQMLSGLRERFAMLKFVPRHTREMIARTVETGDPRALGALAQKADVAVLFSDIRGFTALSDTLAPQRVIEMLNIYLKREAEIIERHGGSIDKFIGDAVMAIFDGDDRFLRATRAALEVQGAISALNEQHAFERSIEVGIGIAGGEVVMGSIGYENRLEFAVIGRLVNLASRLCGVAQKGEVVVSEAAQRQLDGAFSAEKLEGLKLKGFAEAVTCYRIRAQG